VQPSLTGWTIALPEERFLPPEYARKCPPSDDEGNVSFFHDRLHIVFSAASMRRKRHENVIGIVMNGKCLYIRPHCCQILLPSSVPRERDDAIGLTGIEEGHTMHFSRNLDKCRDNQENLY